MKNRLFALASASLLGLSFSTPVLAESGQPGFGPFAEDTFVHVPKLEFTIASLDLDRFMTGVPLDFSRTERAFSQVRPGLKHDQGMVWLTFKYDGRDGLLAQLRKLRITKKVGSTWRLASPPSYDFGKPAAPDYAFVPRQDTMPTPKPRPEYHEPGHSTVAISESGPGALTVDHLKEG